MFEDLGDFPAAKQDWTSTEWISIGEEYEPTKDGKCPKAYTMLNKQTQKCQFPNRIDIGMHFIKTGGYNGWKESYSKMMQRLHPFINYQFDAYKRPEFVKLFEKNEFQQSVKHICGASNPYFKPFQLSMILNLPGQSGIVLLYLLHSFIVSFLSIRVHIVPMHLDVCNAQKSAHINAHFLPIRFRIFGQQLDTHSLNGMNSDRFILFCNSSYFLQRQQVIAGDAGFRFIQTATTATGTSLCAACQPNVLQQNDLYKRYRHWSMCMTGK